MEGDLAAAAKVPYRVRREGREENGEPFAGIQYMNWRTGRQTMTPDAGEPLLAIQTFSARSIFSDDPAELVPIEKPDTYEEHLADYLPLRGDFANGRVKSWGWGGPLSHRKHQAHGNIEALTSLISATPVIGPGRSTSFKGGALRGAPLSRSTTSRWTPKRVARRAPMPPIAIGEHSFDVHPCHCRRYAVEGFMEGVLWLQRKLSVRHSRGRFLTARCCRRTSTTFW